MNPEDLIEIQAADVDGRRDLRVRGEVSLPRLAPLRESLRQALETGRETVLDLSEVAGIDLCGLQIICSAHRTFRRRGGSLLTTNIPPAVRDFAAAAGFDAERSLCPDRNEGGCVWLHGRSDDGEDHLGRG
jgi:anti-anti-sigma factor